MDISITNVGPRMSMKTKDHIALLWSNALYIYGEKMQILYEIINKYIITFLTMHSEWAESVVHG